MYIIELKKDSVGSQLVCSSHNSDGRWMMEMRQGIRRGKTVRVGAGASVKTEAQPKGAKRAQLL